MARALRTIAMTAVLLLACAPYGGGSDGLPGGSEEAFDAGESGAPAASDAGVDAFTATDGEAGAMTPQRMLVVIGGGAGDWGVGVPQGTEPSIPDVIAAPINDDGSLGAWVSRPPLPSAKVHGNPAVVVGGRWVVVAGQFGTPSSGPNGSVLFSDQAKSGDHAWNATTPFAPPRGGWSVSYGAATDGTSIFVTGGEATAKSVQITSSIATSGVGPWIDAPDLPFAMTETAATVVNGTAFVLGNVTIDGGIELRIVHTTLSGGALSSWTVSSAATTRTLHFGAAAFGDAIYVAGGRDFNNSAVDTVRYSPLVSPGIPQAFKDAAALPGKRSNPCVVAGPHGLYVVGGEPGSGVNSAYDSVYWAAPAGDGAIGAWKTTTPLPTPRSGVSCIVL